MTCPKCGAKPKAIKTELATEGHARLLECKSHGQFWSLERLWKWVVKVAGNRRATAAQPPGNGSATAGQPGISDLPLDISKQPLSPDLNPQSSLLSEPPARAKAKGRPTTNDYTPDFLEFWDGTTMHRGNKKPAFDAWVKAKRGLGVKFPEVKFIITRYNRWAETRQWQEGCALYVSTWINAHGWETEPEPHEFRAQGRIAAARSDGNVEVLGEFLARGNG